MLGSSKAARASSGRASSDPGEEPLAALLLGLAAKPDDPGDLGVLLSRDVDGLDAEGVRVGRGEDRDGRLERVREASMPVSAVSVGGIDRVRRGSTTAISGTSE
jgi:hypothetical protein